MIKVISFDDNSVFQDSIRIFMEDSEDIYLAAMFHTAEDAVRHIRKIQPDVVLLDISMPGMNGLQALSLIIENFPTLKVIMLTTFQDNAKVFAAINSGAHGYVVKGNLVEVEVAIRDAYKGGAHLSPDITMNVMEMLRNQSPLAPSSVFTELSKREIQMLELMVAGKSRKMMAKELFLSENTISGYMKELYRKLGVNSAGEAVREAIVRKIVGG